MPQVGNLTFPNLKLSRAVEVVRRIGELKGHVSVASLATELQMAEKGGAFVGLLAGLRDYHLVEGRGDLALTDTAERIIYGDSPGDGAAARAEAFFSVELFRRMSDRLDNELPPEARLRSVIQEITRESLTSINSKLPTIRSIWADGIQTIGSRAWRAGDREPKEQTQDAQADDSLPPSIPGDVVEVKVNSNVIRVAKSVAEIDMVIRLLSVIRDQVGAEEAQNGTTGLLEEAQA